MSYTCPVCKRTSKHPMDERYQFCVACGGFTSLPEPPGFGWVPFRGGKLDKCYRLLELATVKRGSTFEKILDGQVYKYDGKAFVLEPAPAA